MIYVLSGGGSSLNFCVNAYVELPNSGKENEIAVITETPMTGYVMQAEQPTGTEGLVWIQVGSISTTPVWVDKKRTVCAYPMKAMQYISGAWTALDARVYQDGEWKSWIVVLYEYAKTGSLADFTKIGTFSGGTPSETDTYAGLRIGGNSSSRGGILYKTAPVKLSAGSAVKFYCKTSPSSQSHMLTVFATLAIPSSATFNNFTSKVNLTGVGYSVFTEVPLEIGSDGEYYLGIQAYESGGAGTSMVLNKLQY